MQHVKTCKIMQDRSRKHFLNFSDRFSSFVYLQSKRRRQSPQFPDIYQQKKYHSNRENIFPVREKPKQKMYSWANAALFFSCARSAVWLWAAGLSHKVTETLPRASWGSSELQGKPHAQWLGLQGSTTTQGTTLQPKPAQHHFCHSNSFVSHRSSCTGNQKFKQLSNAFLRNELTSTSTTTAVSLTRETP